MGMDSTKKMLPRGKSVAVQLVSEAVVDKEAVAAIVWERYYVRVCAYVCALARASLSLCVFRVFFNGV